MLEAPQLQLWVDVIFKVGTPLGTLIVAGTIAWLSNRFASRAELEKTNQQVADLITLVKVMQEESKVNQRQDAALTDHESRIRQLEIEMARQ